MLPPPLETPGEISLDRNSSGDARSAVTPANDTISSPREHDLRAASDEQPTPDSPSEWQLFSEPTSGRHWWWHEATATAVWADTVNSGGGHHADG